MTVSSENNSNTYAGNGVQTAFAYTFKILAQGDILVQWKDSDNQITVKTITTHYTVSGVGASAGGNITFTASNEPPTGTTVIFTRGLAKTQLVDYTEYDAFPAETHEMALDRLTMISQQQQLDVDLSLKFDPTEDDFEKLLPNPVAGTFLRAKTTGDGFEWTNIEDLAGTIVSPFAETLLDDTSAADARTTLLLGTLATQSGTFSGTHSGTSSGTNTGDQLIFQTIAVSGQSNVVADTTTDTLTLAAGTGITLTTNATTDTVTITNSISSYTDEQAQDAVGTILDNGSTGDAVFTYDDPTPKISATVKNLKNNSNSVITSDTSGRFTTPNQPCWITGTSLQSDITGDGTDVSTAFNSENVDRNFNGASGVFTVPVTGVYLIYVSLLLTGLAAGHTSGSVFVTIAGTNYFLYSGNIGAARDTGNGITITGSIIVSATATQTMTLHLQVSGGTKTVDITSNSTWGTVLLG